MEVTKRDGRIVQFDVLKITDAIQKAFEDVDGGITEDAIDISNNIGELVLSMDEDMYIEDIQNIVEEELMNSDRKDVAKAYILYRDERNKARECNSDIVKNIFEKADACNIENSNANVDESSFSGRQQEANAYIQKKVALDYIMSDDVAQAHKEGLIYQHDLDSFNVASHNCLNIDFDEIFKNGFKTRNGDVRPPTSFSTACQLVAVAFQCQSQVQFGGVGSIHIDHDLAPFVKKSFIKHYIDGLKYIKGANNEDIQKYKKYMEQINMSDIKETGNKVYQYAMDMLEREGRQSAQGLYHNLNTLESRQGSQVPFTSINFGKDTSTEGRLVSKWLMQASLDGIGKHNLTSIFPISIFQYKQGINANKEDKNYDIKKLAIKSLSKRIYPNWVNCDWSQANENADDVDTSMATMGCRTMIGYDRHGLGYSRVGRGNNVPITIILPKLGIEYGICLNKRKKADLKGFNKAFEDTLKLVEKALMERFNRMASQKPTSAPFMYQNKTIKGYKECDENVYNALKHNTLAIGYLGVAEMCQALFGKNHARSKKAHKFALSVVKRINKFAEEASERNNLNFSCYATPAENLCKTALQTLKMQYGELKNITDREYLTNSHHVPVWEEVSIYEKLKIEAPFCKYPTGGCITYIECESTFMQNTKAIEDIIDYAFKELDIPYLAINFPIDACLECGFQGEFDNKCPSCGSKEIQQLRRVTGYLTTDWHNFNKGKQAEVQDRVKHSGYKGLKK